MKMSDEASRVFEGLCKDYVKAGFPDRSAWTFKPQDGAGAAFEELKAHGLIESVDAAAGTWVLTHAGHRFALGRQ